MEIAKLLICMKDDELNDMVRDACAYQLSNAGTFRKSDLNPIRQYFADWPESVSACQVWLRAWLTRYPLLRSEKKDLIISKIQSIGETWRQHVGLMNLQNPEAFRQTLLKYDDEMLEQMVQEPLATEVKAFTAGDVKDLVTQAVKETVAQMSQKE
jgi:hypothetical protein